ncbi:unnamed protein product [Alopecurus aequalis]
MARPRYDHWWKEVQDINGYAVLLVYMWFAARGIGFLLVTWITVVLLGGFVSDINEMDFWRLTSIALIEILWINGSFVDRVISVPVPALHSSSKTVKNLLTRKWQLADKSHSGHQKLAAVKRVVATVRVVAGWVLLVVHKVLLQLCVFFAFGVIYIGLFVTTSIAIYSLGKHDYYVVADGDKTNMYPAHTVVYILCVVQCTVSLYLLILLRWDKRIVNQVSQAYGFQDGGRAVLDYYYEIMRGCEKSPSSARERNLITYAIELIESKSPSSCLSGTLILDRLLTRQYSDQIKDPTLIQQEEKQRRRRRQQQKKKLDAEDKGLAQLIKKTTEYGKLSRMNMGERKKKRDEIRKKRQQREDVIIVQQRTVIKRLIGSASSSHILHKLLDTLDSKRSYDKKMREAAARVVEHVAGGIRLAQFPRGINCISSLINNFEEFCRLQPDESSSSPSNTNEATTTIVPPSNVDDQQQGNSSSYSSSESDSEPESEPASDYSESETELESYNGITRPSSAKPLNGYKDLVLTGLSILWSLAGSKDNCIIISNTKHLVSKIMAPVSYNLVHHTHHSAWSTSVVDASMRVMLRLIATAKDTKGAIDADLYQQISNNGAIETMENIVKCVECKGGELQMTAMQMLMQLRRGSFTKMLIDCFIKGDRSDVSVRKTAGKELALLFLDSKTVAVLNSKEINDEFVHGLAEIVSQVGNDAECRKSAAEILKHMCIHYTNNDEYPRQKKDYLRILKIAMERLMPKFRKEILLGRGLTGEEGNPGYPGQGTDIEMQVVADGRTNNRKSSNNMSSSPWQNQHHKLYVVLLSLYVTACEKLDLDIDAISPGEGDQGEGVALRFAMRMVQSNRDCISADSLTMIKLSTRMVIETIRKFRGTSRHFVRSADLDNLIDTLTSMLDLEGSMVFGAGTMTVPATSDTIDSLVKQARKLHSEIKNKESEINVS